MKKSLKFKLITGGLIIVIVPLLIIGIFSVKKSSEALLDSGKSKLQQVTQNLANMVELVLEEELKFAKVLSVDPIVKNLASKAFDNELAKVQSDIEAADLFLGMAIKQSEDNYEMFFVADENGVIIADSMEGALRAKHISVTDRKYFKIAKAGKINISSPVKSKASGKPVIVFAVPLKTTTGNFSGVFGTVVKLDMLSEKITNVKLGKTGYPFMVDKNGIIIAHPTPKHILELNLKTLKGMESITSKILAQKTGVEEYTFKGVDKVSGFAPVPITGWGICATQNKDEFISAANKIRNMIFFVSISFIAFTVIAILWFARSIVLPINRIIEGLIQGAGQVAAASGEISSTSQSLAEGSSQQAASIEETSSSMEEMSSMTKKNAENASHADGLMKEANTVVSNANESMGQLTLSMDDISKASKETSKIIKTIDEIAFQTNLLALNAAVEAARAGEAGAGFAVVADEVRNLAMRAADAAKNTAGLIEGTVKNVNDGSELVSATNHAFSQVAETTSKVGDIVAEISEASNEQSSGIEQVNTAITEMDNVVQQNAANAEESASASEEMNAQAEQLKEYVGDLFELVTGKRNQNISPGGARTIKPVSHTSQPYRPSQKKMLTHDPKEVRPGLVTPFDEENDFQNF